VQPPAPSPTDTRPPAEQVRGPSKRLVVCTDGTWNDLTKGHPTNVLKVARAVKRHDPEGIPQIVYYHSGVGTGTDFVDRFIGGATGFGISRNICDAYNFVVQNYAPGDQLFLFGFSRGAYTARSLAGLIRNCGILRPEHGHRFTEAYELYRSRDPGAHPEAERSVEFRERYCHPASAITFVGVWDTVGALGVPLGFARYLVKLYGLATGKPLLYEFHDVTLSSFIDHAYHAVAIDEKREAFRPALWTVSKRRGPNQTFEQEWFRGAHSNVGGGYRATGLSDAALSWMADRAERHGLRLSLDVLDPPVRPRDEPPEENQSVVYRLLAVLKKVNAATVQVGLSPLEIADLEQRVDWRGDYHRPVPGGAAFASYASPPPDRPGQTLKRAG
jgi:uncharacterized protein (DUF2235 family)